MRKNLQLMLIGGLLGFAYLSPLPVQAACQPIFGGGITCTESTNIAVNKAIQVPGSTELVDNLGPASPLIVGQSVVFKITVANTGKTKLTHISVKDFLPKVISSPSGGTFDPKDNSISYPIDALDAGRTTVATITGKIADVSANATCYANQVTVLVSGKKAQDNVSFCVAGKNTVVAQTPSKTNQTNTTQSQNTIMPSQSVQPGRQTTPVYPQPKSKQTPATGPDSFSLALLPAAFGLGKFLQLKTKSQSYR